MLNSYDSELYASEREFDPSQSPLGPPQNTQNPQTAISFHTQSPNNHHGVHVNNNLDNVSKATEKSSMANKTSSSLVILDDSTDDEYDEMMSYSFTCTNANRTRDGEKAVKRNSNPSPMHGPTPNILKDSNVPNTLVTIPVQETSTKATRKECDKAIDGKEKKRKNPDSLIVTENKPKPNSSPKTGIDRKECKTIEATASGSISNNNPTNIVETATLPSTKKKKLTFQDQVLQHLLVSMKPFNLKTLASDLKTTDVALHNLMLSLIDKKIVIRKEFTSSSNSNNTGGEKQKRSKELYWIDVDKATQALRGSSETKTWSESEKKAAIVEKERLIQEEADVRRQWSDIANALPIQVIRKKVEEEEQEVEKLRKRYLELKNLSGAKSNAVKTCPKPLEKKIAIFKSEWKKRKQQCLDFVENLADAMEKKKKDVLKDLQLEMDNTV